jgi:hypothetical protein
VTKYYNKSVEIEKNMDNRVQELLIEIGDKNNLLENETARADNAEAAMLAAQSTLVAKGEGDEMVLKSRVRTCIFIAFTPDPYLLTLTPDPCSEMLTSAPLILTPKPLQLTEMEALFVDTVSRLSKRVIELEKTKKGGPFKADDSDVRMHVYICIYIVIVIYIYIYMYI